MSNKARRGEIYWVDWDPGRGSEQTGRRPALIIQNDSGNEYGATTIVAACSTAPKKQYPFLVSITSKESGLPKDCSIEVESITKGLKRKRIAIRKEKTKGVLEIKAKLVLN